MNIDYTVTALMFPAIPLTMNIYSSRFHTLSNLIRELHDEHVYENHIPPEWKKQFINLNGRINLLKLTIMFAAFGFLFNMLTVFALYFNEIFFAQKKRIYKALINSSSVEINSFNNVLKKIINE